MSADASIPRPRYPALNDPARPAWHFAPPAFWMNDPNGTFQHAGWHHLFYQHNPGADEWGDLHWGHARSRDLVQWEHLPIALCPQHARGEMHCYSGCAAIDADGAPRLLYTSVPPGAAENVSQVIASPNDDALLSWTQHVGTPFLDLATHDGPKFDRDWRDPYVFRAEGRTFLILGATLGDEAVVPLYENPGGDLKQWTYRGILLRAPQRETRFFECPNLIALGSKWVLLASPCREVEWWSGTLDLARYEFHVERHGRVDQSDHFYATQTTVEENGRTILFAWAQKFPKARGWNGCLGVPRRAWLDDEGWLCTEPIAEIATLRGTPTKIAASHPGHAAVEIALPGDHSHDVELTFERGPTATIRIECMGVVIVLGPNGVRFGDRTPVMLARTGATRVRWLLDRSLLEIFVGERASFTRVVAFPSPSMAKVFFEGPARLVDGRAWPLGPT